MHDHTKTSDYELLIKQAQALIADESDFIANIANLSALIYHNLDELNWAGFYLMKEHELVLGPFQGLSACTRIKVGKGVCGTSAKLKNTLNIPNVHLFDGHIACDSASNSECVVPILSYNEVIGVLDVDSPIMNRFDESTQKFLEDLISLIEAKHFR